MCEFEKVAEGIYFLKTPFEPVYSAVVFVDGDEKLLIDSGASGQVVQECIIPALEKLGVGTDDISWLLNTHCHGDHIGGHKKFSELGVKIAAFDKAADRLSDPVGNAVRIRTKFPKHSPPPQTFLQAVCADRIIAENELVGGRIMPIYTPGHDSDCVCFYDVKTKSAICGDSLQGNGTICQGVGFYMSLDDYEYTLDKLESMDIENLFLGHDYDGLGDIIYGRENVKKCLKKCREYVNEYDRFIISEMKAGKTDAAEIAESLIKNMGVGMPEKLFMAIYTATNHMERKEKLK